MSWRDVLLAMGILPVLAVVGWRLGAESGLLGEVPPSTALPVSLAAFGFVFLVYVALTLRAIARATREILGREDDLAGAPRRRGHRATAVSDFAIHLDRSAEIDLRAAAPAEAASGFPPDDDDPEEAPAAVEDRVTAQPERAELFGEVRTLLTRIPSVRQGGTR